MGSKGSGIHPASSIDEEQMTLNDSEQDGNKMGSISDRAGSQETKENFHVSSKTIDQSYMDPPARTSALNAVLQPSWNPLVGQGILTEG